MGMAGRERERETRLTISHRPIKWRNCWYYLFAWLSLQMAPTKPAMCTEDEWLLAQRIWSPAQRVVCQYKCNSDFSCYADRKVIALSGWYCGLGQIIASYQEYESRFALSKCRVIRTLSAQWSAAEVISLPSDHHVAAADRPHSPRPRW